MMKSLFTLFALLAATIPASLITASPKELLEVDRYTDLKVSPDGKRLAGKFQRDDGRIKLVVRDLEKHRSIFVGPANPAQGEWGEKSVSDFEWINNDYIALTASWDDGIVGLHLAKVPGLKNQDVIQNIEFQSANSLVDPIPGSTQYIVSRSPADQKFAECSVVKLDAADRKFKEILYSSSSKAFEAITDRDHTLRLVKKQESPDSEAAWYALPPGGDAWKKLKLNQWLPVFGFDTDPDRILVGGSFGNLPAGIYYYSLSQDKVVRKLINHEELPLNRFAEPIFDPANGHLLGVHINKQKPVTQWIDPSLKNIQANIDRASPDSMNRIISWDMARKRVLVRKSYASQPSVTYAFDFNKGKMDLVCRNGGNLKSKDLATTQHISITNRDGLSLDGFLTKSPKAKKNSPILVIVRNDPFATLDTIGWKNEDQFYAKEGFAVLRLNFSGSGGLNGPLSLNWNNENAPIKPIQDLEDALKWAKTSGHGDPSKAAIIGYGAGGWIAAYSTIASPHLFDCAVSTGGIYDLVEYQNKDTSSPISSVAPIIFAECGYKLSHEALNRLSPMQNASKITSSLMLSYGQWDQDGYKEHVKAFAKTASDAGVSVAPLYKGGWWGTNITNNSDVYDFNKRIAAFLKKNL
ncbi:alpha/beta hydrolase family protein [Pelagicoccus mobilis]|uniref:Prolyl oligopeptidase family serine peptidase n=1 Tax=Pelagicoccus mobilis TaxID=415221 RepID=A0A934RTT2_9BACT|nr:prolyl oligopeptidase family serine peptidase [Pelagicoccus mobilis]MBK1875265.1 prolyl oligopeptidase family serine peptidase [Pelagicoccus mobilis]